MKPKAKIDLKQSHTASHGLMAIERRLVTPIACQGTELLGPRTSDNRRRRAQVRLHNFDPPQSRLIHWRTFGQASRPLLEEEQRPSVSNFKLLVMTSFISFTIWTASQRVSVGLVDLNLNTKPRYNA